MLTQTTYNNITYFELNIGCISFISFTLSDLLEQVPAELKNLCLMQLN